MHARELFPGLLERAGVDIRYTISHGRKDHVKLCFDRYPVGHEPPLWRLLCPTKDDCREALRGHHFRVVAYLEALASDRQFWRG